VFAQLFFIEEHKFWCRDCRSFYFVVSIFWSKSFGLVFLNCITQIQWLLVLLLNEWDILN